MAVPMFILDGCQDPLYTGLGRRRRRRRAEFCLRASRPIFQHTDLCPKTQLAWFCKSPTSLFRAGSFACFCRTHAMAAPLHTGDGIRVVVVTGASGFIGSHIAKVGLPYRALPHAPAPPSPLSACRHLPARTTPVRWTPTVTWQRAACRCLLAFGRTRTGARLFAGLRSTLVASGRRWPRKTLPSLARTRPRIGLCLCVSRALRCRCAPLPVVA